MNSTCSIHGGVAQGLIDSISNSINSGELSPGAKIGTEVELARQYSISRNSVRGAISKLVDDGLVDRLPGKGIFVADQISATRIIQIVLPSLSYEVWARFARGVKQLATQRGINVQIYDAHGDMDADIDFVKKLPESFASGAIIPPLSHPLFAEAMFDLKRENYPLVLVEDALWQGLRVSTVTADDYDGGKIIGQELIALGHERIAYIGVSGSASSKCRLEGLRDAVGEAGLPFSPSLAVDMEVKPLEDWSGPIAEATQRVMSLSPSPTAIIYSCDASAAHGYNTLRKMGLNIPGDVSVVGFDDEPLCQFLDPPLSTVRPPSEKMGMVALEMLLEQIDADSEEEAPIRHSALTSEFVRRDSIAEICS